MAFMNYFTKILDTDDNVLNTPLTMEYKHIINETKAIQNKFQQNDTNILFAKLAQFQEKKIKSKNLFSLKNWIKPAFAFSTLIIVIFLFINIFSQFIFPTQNHSFILKKVFQKDITVVTKNTAKPFVMTKNIRFIVFPHSTIEIKNKALILKNGRLIGEYFKKGAKENKNYPIYVGNIKIQVIGTKFYVSKERKQISIFVENGHLNVYQTNNRIFSLTNQSYLETKNNLVKTGTVNAYLKIPFSLDKVQGIPFSQSNFNFYANYRKKLNAQNTQRQQHQQHLKKINLNLFSNIAKNNMSQHFIPWWYNAIIKEQKIITNNDIHYFSTSYKVTNHPGEAGVKIIFPDKIRSLFTEKINSLTIDIKSEIDLKKHLIIKAYSKGDRVWVYRITKNNIKKIGKHWNKVIVSKNLSLWDQKEGPFFNYPNFPFTDLLALSIITINTNTTQWHTTLIGNIKLLEEK